MEKDKIFVLEEYNKERKGNIKYHEINKPESNPIFNYYFKKQQIKHYDEEKYNFMYHPPFLENWTLGKKPKRMNNHVYFSLHLENYVRYGRIPEKILHRSCPVCFNNIKKSQDHFINSLCNHPVCVNCFFNLKILYPEYYGECRECPLCKGELRTWGQCKNLFNINYLKPDEYYKFKGTDLIFLNDDDLKRYIMFYNTFIKKYINEKGQYYNYDVVDKEKQRLYKEKCEKEFDEIWDDYLKKNNIIKN